MCYTDSRHVEDYHAAVEYIRGGSLAGKVDSKRVAIWGTSFAGGHVLEVAAGDEGIKAVISQVRGREHVTDCCFKISCRFIF